MARKLKSHFKIVVSTFDGYQDVPEFDIKVEGYSRARMANKAQKIARTESKNDYSAAIYSYPGGKLEEVYINGRKV